MKAIDLNSIEQRLAIRLPKIYKSALEEMVVQDRSSTQEFLCEPVEILVLNLELRMSPRNDGFNGGPWPAELLAIGEDGCGNFFAIDTRDRASKVLVFDHESDRFEVDSPTLAEFKDRLHASRLARTDVFGTVEEGSRAFSSEIELTVARATVPRHSVLNPITLEEWTKFVEEDSELVLKGYRIGVNPFTQEEVRFEYPGLAVYAGEDGEELLYYAFGRITVRQPSPSASLKLSEAAGSLNARVL